MYSMYKKLVYILPEASEKTHMKYNVEFISALAKEKNIDIFLILERGYDKNSGITLPEYLEQIKQKTGVKNIHYTGTNILRIPKLKIFLLKSFLLGYRKVYIHYSFVGAIYASLNPFFTTYYWNCGIPWNYKRPFLQEMYESLAYKLIDHFVTGANILTQQYASFYKFDNSKSIVIPNWIDVEMTVKIKNQTDKELLIKELNIASGQKVIFFNQRLAERKGAHYILPILKNISQSQDVVMIITNDGPYKEKLLTGLKENNLEDKVRMLGKVNVEKVIQIFSISDLYILPSEEEGMSHSLMEAMCSAVPAVSYDVGGTREMYPQGFRNFVINVGDINSFTAKINELLNNSDLAKQLGTKLFEKVKEYDKNIILEEFVNKVIN